ncbi:hypothetical protein QCA50_018079 [Cerrena zonata]|uniref:Uncharacterized protein n=1 Tax=Cerrena zonata TaxID=2478898 RepID=A0AAW0FL64_9APHY
MSYELDEDFEMTVLQPGTTIDDVLRSSTESFLQSWRTSVPSMSTQEDFDIGVEIEDEPEEVPPASEGWGEDMLSAEEEEEYVAVSAFDKLSENFLRQGMQRAEDITPEDLAFLRPFALKVDSHMPGGSRVANLSGFEPREYDCCINSCCCFVGPYADDKQCFHCNEPRFDSQGKRRQVFVYLPVIPRLKAFLANTEMAKKMQYRNEHQHNPDVVKDARI